MKRCSNDWFCVIFKDAWQTTNTKYTAVGNTSIRHLDAAVHSCSGLLILFHQIILPSPHATPQQCQRKTHNSSGQVPNLGQSAFEHTHDTVTNLIINSS